jgi:DNA-binding PadR family transcriptional regulator
MNDISTEARAVLAQLDDVWVMFDEIWPYAGVPKSRVAPILRGLKSRGFVATRVSDAHGRTEYAITEEGDRELGRD